jgi:hypothetical protein
MTKRYARQLILVLVAHHVPYKLSRDGSGYIVAFAQHYVARIQQAIGA